MARRLIEDDLNKKKRKPTASISTIQNVAKQVKSAPVKRQTMNLQTNRATAKPSVQKQATSLQPNRPVSSPTPQKQTRFQPAERKVFEPAPAWSPVTDPEKEYFTPVVKPPKERTPEQQRRHDIMQNAIREIEPIPDEYLNPDINAKNLASSLAKGTAGAVQNIAINNPATTLRASADRWRNYTPDEEHYFVELSPELRNELAERADRNAQALWDSTFNKSLDTRIEQLSNPLDGTLVGNIMEGTGGMIPSMVASYFTGMSGMPQFAEGANMATMLAGAYGGSAREALDQGVDPQRAVAAGLTNAAIEYLTENLNPYVPGTFGQIPGLADIIGEGGEEAVGRLVEPFTNLILQDDQSLSGIGKGLVDIWNQNFSPWNGSESPLFNTLVEAGEAGLAGMGSAALLGGAQSMANRAIGASDTTTEYENISNGLKEQLGLLESIDTPEANAERQAIQQLLDGVRDQVLTVENLRSTDAQTRRAAQQANTDRIMENAARLGINSNLAQNMAKICNKIGITMSFDDTMDASLNGMYKNGHITISSKAADPVEVVFSHELTHAIEKGDAYMPYRNMLYELANSGILGGTHGTVQQLQDLIRQPQNYGADISQAELDSETTAILTQDLLGNEDAINHMVNANRGLAIRIYENIRDTLSKFGATAEERTAIDNKRSLQRAEDLFRDALETPATIQAETAQEQEEGSAQYSRVLDKGLLDFLNNQEYVTVYRAMWLGPDGKLYPPMATKLKNPKTGKWELQDPTEFGVWYQSDEHPEMIGKNGKFLLKKDNGGDVPAAYNPYWHTSLSMLNDQFTSAYKRPGLVVVRGVVPASELTSGYQAQGAKDPVGETAWHSGVVSTELEKYGKNARRVILSRWFKAMEVVPDAEVAASIKDMVDGTPVEIPYNVVTPSLRRELEKLGVPIGEGRGIGNLPKKDEVQYSRRLTNQAPGQMQLDLDGMPAGTDLSGGPQIINEEEGETVDLRNDPLRTMLRDQGNRDIMDRFIDRGPTVIDEDASESETIINPGSELRERMEKAVNDGDMTATKEATRDAVTEIFNDELADQPQDEATARLRQSIEDDINIRLNDIAPNQTMEKVAKGELNASKTARDTAQIGLDRETNDVEHIVHHKNDFMNSTVSRRNATGSFKEFFDQIMSNPMMDQAAPVGTIYRGNPISTAIARGKQFAENVKNARTGRAEEELYAHMADLEYAINESTTIEKQIEKEASDKGITLEVLPAPMGKTIVRAYDADGVALDTDEAKEFVRRLDEQRAMTEALRKERAGIGSVGGTILNYMKEGDAANMTPASQLEVLQLAVDGINNDLQAKLRKKFKKGLLSPITINQEFKNKFLDFDTTQETRSQMVNDFLKSEARKYPHTVVEQIDNFRYGNMLFRTTTWIRNKGGNELGQGMYNAKNVTAYFLERLLENSGRVADYNVDLDNEADQQFVIDSYNAIENKLSNDIAENKNIKDHSDRVKKFRELGYTGSLLTEMANYRGDTYNTKMNADKLGKVAQQLVTNYKNSGVADFASADPAEFTKQMVEAYNQNEKQLINREDLRHITTEGKMAKGDTALAKELWKEQFSEAAKKNSKTTNTKRKSGLQGVFYDEYNSKPFTIGQTLFNTESGPVSALLNKRNDITNYAMNEMELPILGRFGDQPFQRDRWAKSFTSRLASQGYELAKNDKGQFIIKDHNLRDSQEIIRKYGQEAALEAAESVYRDDNKWADLVNDAREISLTGKLILDAELAFTRTPFNIFRRAIEYSPVGFVKSMNNLRHVKDGSMTASQWIDDTAKGLTGTGLFALGVVLAEAGIITGDRSDEDDEEKKYRNTLGMNDYSLVIPDELGGGTYSLDWAAPSVSAVLCGAQLVQIFNTMVPHKEGETLTDYLKRASGEVPGALWALAQPILDTTMMQNLLDTMGSIGDADRNTVESIVENYVGQFTGSMGASLRKVWDDTARSTYSDNFYDRLLRQARNKSILVDAGTKLIQKMTTGESHDLEPQLDSKGNEIKNVGGNMAGRFLYNMISPGTYKSNTEDKTDTELLRLYNSKEVGSNSDLLPAQLYKLRLDGQQYKFTPEERTELNKYYLQGMRSAVEKYMSSSLYRQQSDKERADTIQKIQDYYYTKVKEQYFSKVAPGEAKDMVKGINRTADVLSKSLGVSLYQAFGLGNVEGVKGHDGQTISNSRAMEARNYLEAIGVDMDDVKKLVDSGKLKYADLGLTEKVASWTPTEFRDNVHDLEDGLYGSERVYTILGDGAKMGNDQIDHLRSLESDKDEKGETIRNSRAYKAKEYLMEIGVYDDVVKMINEGKLEPGDVYLNKTVMGSAYKYRGNSGSGSSGRRSSGGGSSRKRSSTTDMDKLYEKLYNMAMSGTLDSIGDLASQIGRQAQTNYGPKSQTTNHEALINELEKMVSQQQNKPR